MPGLRLGEGVRTPLADAARVEIVMAAPACPGRRPSCRAARGKGQATCSQSTTSLGGWGSAGSQAWLISAASHGAMWARTVWTLPSRPVRASSIAATKLASLKTLGAGLVDAAVMAGRLDHRAALGDGHARGLLGVDVLARPHGHDGGQSHASDHPWR